MAISFDESDDYFVISDAATLTLPDSDWCVAIWTFVSDNAGNDLQYVISSNNFGVNNSLNIWLAEEGNANAGKWIARVQDGDGDFVDIIGAGAPGADSKWRLILFQRVDADSEVQIWYCEPGQTATKENNGWDVDLGASDGGDWNIGRRTDGNVDRYYGSLACEFFKGDFSLSQAEITALGAGLTVYELGYTPDVYWPMITSEATLYDLFGSHNGTRQSAPTTTTEHAPVGVHRKAPYLRVPIYFTESMTGAITPAGALIRQPQKVLAGATTPTGALINQTGKVLSGTITPAATLVNQTGKVLSGAITPAATLARETQKITAGTLTSAGVLARQFGKSLAGTLTFAGAIIRQVSKVLSGSITPTATLTSPSFPVGVAAASRALRIAMTGSPLRGA